MACVNRDTMAGWERTNWVKAGMLAPNRDTALSYMLAFGGFLLPFARISPTGDLVANVLLPLTVTAWVSRS
jgi:hypothetical protein